jgi:hypothetical protein
LIDENGSVTREYEDGLDLQSERASKRLSQLLYQLRMVNVTYGLIRSSAVRQTDLLAQLAMIGRFCEIPEPLFFRRVHREMTVQKHQSLHERAVWLNPALEGRLIFPHWNILGQFMRSIWKAPISWKERWGCFLRLLIWLKRYRDDLLGDLAWAVRHIRGAALGRANEHG